MAVISQMRDFLSLAGKITPARFSNGLRILNSFNKSKSTGNPIINGLPVAISVEPTTSCNLRCPQCPSGLRSFTRPTGMLDKQLFEKVIDELHETLLYLTFYFQGEPYLNPEFLNMVRYASDKNIYTSTSTNAHYLDNKNAKNTVFSGLNKLIISIDGTTQESFEKYRIGGKLDKVLEGINNLIKWKKELKSASPFIVIQFIVFRHNEHEINEIKKIAKQLGVHLQIKTAQVYDDPGNNEILPLNPKYQRYQNNNKLLNECWKMWHSCVITWDGKIVPCCFDKDAKHQLGDINQTSFKEVWQSDPYKNFRASLLRSRDEIEICTNCSEGAKVFI
jgi:radical SAM protein with 4Fe4S-binding SPASM domain